MSKTIDYEKGSDSDDLQAPSVEVNEVVNYEAQGIAVPKTGFLHKVCSISPYHLFV